jgi:hypothetical protein
VDQTAPERVSSLHKLGVPGGLRSCELARLVAELSRSWIKAAPLRGATGAPVLGRPPGTGAPELNSRLERSAKDALRPLCHVLQFGHCRGKD